MSNIDKLKEEELAQIEGTLNLEDLIILGDDKKIPITITFPQPNGEPVKAKALIKQLTLTELEKVDTSKNNLLETSTLILKKALFKQDGTLFTTKELKTLPVGVIIAISNKIMEVSGMDDFMEPLKDF